MKRNTLITLISLLFMILPGFSVTLPDLYKTQDVNGFMPEKVYIRTMTQTYCKGYNFVVVDGRIYVKKEKDSEWTLFLKKGVPFSRDNKHAKSYFEPPHAIREICADGDSLFAFDADGVLYNCYINFGTTEKLFVWKKLFGWPKRNPLVQNDLVLNKRGWSMGVRRGDILWYTDRFGNEHHYGTMGLETIYFLTQDGQHIRFTDSGLPTDFSHSIQCPRNGAFIAQNISVSGDTIFLIGSDGTMYTRLIDFDTMGCDPMFFKYTYVYEKQNYKGSDYLSNYTPWALPAEDWKQEPSISITGKARLSKAISIAQTGTGNLSRELRVAGTDMQGRVGYYHKMIGDRQWGFTLAPLELEDELYLDGKNPVEKAVQSYSYEGYLAQNGTTLEGYTVRLDKVFLTSEEKATLTIRHGDEQFALTLYALEMWTYMVRYNPGFDGTAKNYFITAQFDEKQKDSLSPAFRQVLDDLLDKKNNKLFALSGEATNLYFQIECTGKDNRSLSDPLAKTNHYLLFLAKNATSAIHPDVYKGSLVMLQPLLREADAPELQVDGGTAYNIRDRSLVENKIELNRAYQKKLQHEMDVYKEYQKDADTSRWGYKAVDLITTVTFLNQIDFPKIKTMTSYGDELMNTNAKSFANIVAYREWCYPHIMELVNLRIDSLNDVINEFNDNKIYAQVDTRLRNSFNAYFELVSLPVRIEGTSDSEQVPARLEQIDFVPYFPGYILQIDNNVQTTILIELKGAAKKIFDRSPEKTLAEAPFAVPVSFATVSLVSNSATSGEAPVKDQYAKLDGKRGKLIWNGKTLLVTVQNTFMSSSTLFTSK